MYGYSARLAVEFVVQVFQCPESETVMEKDNGEGGETQLSLFPAIVMPDSGYALTR